MSNNLFSKVDGKSIIVGDFQIENYNENLHIKITCISEDKNAYFIVFENVSKLKMSDISYPFQICGFEILDYSSRGYQKDSRFFVNDYEDGKLSFLVAEVGFEPHDLRVMSPTSYQAALLRDI